jgi:predicted trehalose synthase
MLDTKENLKGKSEAAAVRTTATGSEGSMAGGIVEAVKEQVQAVASGASGLAGKAKDTAQEWASSVGGAAVQAKDKARDVASAAAEKVGELGPDLTALIRRHPLEALLAGFGMGFAVGFLVAHVLRRS